MSEVTESTFFDVNGEPEGGVLSPYLVIELLFLEKFLTDDGLE